jgi:hypothetical protein
MITINQSMAPDLRLDELPGKGQVYLLCNGQSTVIEYEAIPELIQVLQNYLRAS